MSEPQLMIGLTNPKSPTNVGAVMRASGCFGVDAVRYTGARYERAAKFHTDTHRASIEIPLQQVDELTQQLPLGMKVVCIELVEGATPLPEFEHPERAIYLFGPEDGSLSQQVVSQADAVVYVPTNGCLNLAATVNVLLYDRLAKSDFNRGDELVVQSRDINNRLRC